MLNIMGNGTNTYRSIYLNDYSYTTKTWAWALIPHPLVRVIQYNQLAVSPEKQPSHKSLNRIRESDNAMAAGNAILNYSNIPTNYQQLQ